MRDTNLFGDFVKCVKDGKSTGYERIILRIISKSYRRFISNPDLKNGKKRKRSRGDMNGILGLTCKRSKMKDSRKVTGEKENVIGSDPGEQGSKWNRLPNELLLKIFEFLSVEYLVKASQVCRIWNAIGQNPLLWRSVEIKVGSNSESTPQDLIQYILENHSRNLKSVIFRTDSAKESAERVCQIIKKLVHCSLQTLAIVSCARPVFLDIDQESFTSALKAVFHGVDTITNLVVDYTPIDDPSLKMLARNHAKSLQLLKLKSCPMVSPEGILALTDHCHRLKELSLNYASLSDQILLSLSSEQHVRLTHLRIDVYTDRNWQQKKKISTPCWHALINHSPNINLAMYFYVVDVETYDLFFHSYNPVTHVYFCEYVPRAVLQRIPKNCPRIMELVVNGTDGPNIDLELIDLGLNCSKLMSIGLSDCFVTSSAFVEFVKISRKRLSELFITEDCLLENSPYDLQKVIDCVSDYLSTKWEPEFIPLW